MKTTIIKLEEKELVDIINQIANEKDREIVKEKEGDENTISIDHEHIKFIDPLYLIDELPIYQSENEWTTPIKLNIIGCRCYGDGNEEIEISKYAQEAIATTLGQCFYIEDEVKTIEK